MTKKQFNFDMQKVNQNLCDSVRIIESEEILRQLFPDLNEKWIKWSNIIHKETKFIAG